MNPFTDHKLSTAQNCSLKGKKILPEKGKGDELDGKSGKHNEIKASHEDAST